MRLRSRKQPFFWSWSRFSVKIRLKQGFWRVTIKKYADLLIVIWYSPRSVPRNCSNWTQLSRKTMSMSLETLVSTLFSNWLQLSRTDLSTGITAGEYAGQRFKAGCTSYADGSLRLLCAPECRSGFHTADDISQSQKRAPLKTLYINNIDILGSVKLPDPHTLIYLSIRWLSATLHNFLLFNNR